MAGGSIANAIVNFVPKFADGSLSALEKKLENSGNIGGAKFAGALKAMAGAAVVAKAGQIAAEVFMGAFNNAAENEQLVGGVETLFGAGGKTLEQYAESVGKTTDEVAGKYSSLMAAQEAMLQNAKGAYASAGLSANEYMEQATSFSASLIQSLGGDTVKAADYADMAMVDMSDNANKMGSSMESITNAYQGFAKQNYTMLDNLSIAGGMAA